MKNNLKIALSLCLMVCCCISAFSQDSLHIVLQNQYNAKLKQAKLYLNNDTASYITNDKGEVSFLAKPTDQFRIVHKDYDSVTLLVSQVPSSHVIEVKKPSVGKTCNPHVLYHQWRTLVPVNS